MAEPAADRAARLGGSWPCRTQCEIVRAVEVAAFVIGCISFVLALIGLAWQIYSWKADRRFNVVAEIEQWAFSAKHWPLRVVVRNEGKTSEAVELIDLTYFVEGTDLGFGLTATPERPELQPNRHATATFDLADRPTTTPIRFVTATGKLESGRLVFATSSPAPAAAGACSAPPASM
jgi:hypothetical protein